MKLTSSIITFIALTSMSFAGGDIIPPVMEQEVVQVPVEPVYVPAPVEEYVAPAPVEEYVAPVMEEYIAPPAEMEEYVPPPAPTPEYVAPPVPTPAPVEEYVAPPAPTPAPTPAPVVTKKTPLVVAPVVAEALGLYVAGGITQIAVREVHEDAANLFSDEDNQERQLGFTGRLGYDFMDYLGAEIRGTYGFDGDKEDFQQVGIYLKPNYSFGDINLYGLLGYSQANMDDWADLSTTETGFSYGAGLDYKLGNKVSVFTDVLNYLTEDDSTSQWGLTVGAAYQF